MKISCNAKRRLFELRHNDGDLIAWFDLSTGYSSDTRYFLNALNSSRTALELFVPGAVILVSYTTPIMALKDGVLYGLRDSISATTTKHKNQWVRKLQAEHPQARAGGQICSVRYTFFDDLLKEAEDETGKEQAP